MAANTQQDVYLILCKAYVYAIQSGLELVPIQVGHLADVLTYLNSADKSRSKIEKPLDDYTVKELQEAIMYLAPVREKGPSYTQSETHGDELV
jgi:hypothetical protein